MCPESTVQQGNETDYLFEMESPTAVTRRIKITIPEQMIQTESRQLMSKVRNDVAVPGFRRGRTPNRVLEKRLGGALSEEMQRELVNAALAECEKRLELKTVGQMVFTPDKPELPTSGPMQFSVEVEIMPEFPLPDLAGIEILDPQLQVTDERLASALGHLQRSLGTWEPVSDVAAMGDRVTADVEIHTEDGTGVVNQPGATLTVGPGGMAGVQFDDLGEKLAGCKPGDAVALEKVVPDTHFREDLRGRKFIVKIAVKSISRLNMPELTDDLAKQNGFDNLEELRRSMRGALEDRIKADIVAAKRQQLLRKLVESTQFETPPRFTLQLSMDILRRDAQRYINSGQASNDTKKLVSDMQGHSKLEAEFEVRKVIIISRFQEQFREEVTEREINTAIAQMAAMSGERPETARRQLERTGRLQDVAMRVVEDKVLDRALQQCKITLVDEETWRNTSAAGERPAADAT